MVTIAVKCTILDWGLGIDATDRRTDRQTDESQQHCSTTRWQILLSAVDTGCQQEIMHGPRTYTSDSCFWSLHRDTSRGGVEFIDWLIYRSIDRLISALTAHSTRNGSFRRRCYGVIPREQFPRSILVTSSPTRSTRRRPREYPCSIRVRHVRFPRDCRARMSRGNCSRAISALPATDTAV